MPKTKLQPQPIDWRKKAIEPVETRGGLAPLYSQGLSFEFEVSDETHANVLTKAQFWTPEITRESVTKEEFLAIQEIRKSAHFQILWVIKEQSKMIRPKLRSVLGEKSYSLFLAHEAYGDILNALFNLSYGVFDFLEIDDGQSLEEYSSWGDLWYCIIAEKFQIGVDSILEKEGYQRLGRKQSIAYLEQLRRSLEGCHIPQGMPAHLKALLTHGAMIAQHNPKERSTIKRARRRFRELYWQPYLKALKRCEIWQKSLIHPDRSLPDGIVMIWPQRDPKTKHFYSKKSTGEKKFVYREALRSI